MARESTTGKIFMIVMPVLVFAPALATSIRTMPTWLALMGLATIGLAEIGAVCFFFPEQTVQRVYEWRHRRYAMRSGYLRTEEVRRLIQRRANRYPSGPKSVTHEEWNLIGLIARLADRDPAYGHAATRWIRGGHDLTLLMNAAQIPLPAHALVAHMEGATPLDPAAIATLAALRGDPFKRQRPHDPPPWSLTTSMSLATRTATLPASATPQCNCGATHLT